MSHNGPKWTREFIEKQRSAAAKDVEARAPKSSLLLLGARLRLEGKKRTLHKLRLYWTSRELGQTETKGLTLEEVEALLREYGYPPNRPKLMR